MPSRPKPWGIKATPGGETVKPLAMRAFGARLDAAEQAIRKPVAKWTQAGEPLQARVGPAVVTHAIFGGAKRSATNIHPEAAGAESAFHIVPIHGGALQAPAVAIGKFDPGARIAADARHRVRHAIQVLQHTIGSIGHGQTRLRKMLHDLVGTHAEFHQRWRRQAEAGAAHKVLDLGFQRNRAAHHHRSSCRVRMNHEEVRRTQSKACSGRVNRFVPNRRHSVQECLRAASGRCRAGPGTWRATLANG